MLLLNIRSSMSRYSRGIDLSAESIEDGSFWLARTQVVSLRARLTFATYFGSILIPQQDSNN